MALFEIDRPAFGAYPIVVYVLFLAMGTILAGEWFHIFHLNNFIILKGFQILRPQSAL
jgi:hypothetical protein